jgi:hypothetical protein
MREKTKTKQKKYRKVEFLFTPRLGKILSNNAHDDDDESFHSTQLHFLWLNFTCNVSAYQARGVVIMLINLEMQSREFSIVI